MGVTGGYFWGGAGAIPHIFDSPPPPISDSPPVYFRALVNFTRSIDYSQQLEDPESEEFREVSEAVVDTVRGHSRGGGWWGVGGTQGSTLTPPFSAPPTNQLESEYYKVPGEQVVSVVFIK